MINGLFGIMGFSTDLMTFGYLWVDRLWFAGWTIYLLVAGSIIAALAANVMEESRLKQTLSFFGIMFGIFFLAWVGAYAQIFMGQWMAYLIYIPAIAYVSNSVFEGKTGVYMSIIFLAVMFLVMYLMPGLFDLWGYANWRNWQDSLTGTSYGPGYGRFLGSSLEDLIGAISDTSAQVDWGQFTA
jgi:hypothetical protein